MVSTINHIGPEPPQVAATPLRLFGDISTESDTKHTTTLSVKQSNMAIAMTNKPVMVNGLFASRDLMQINRRNGSRTWGPTRASIFLDINVGATIAYGFDGLLRSVVLLWYNCHIKVLGKRYSLDLMSRW
jgi:hypothetical protein